MYHISLPGTLQLYCSIHYYSLCRGKYARKHMADFTNIYIYIYNTIIIRSTVLICQVLYNYTAPCINIHCVGVNMQDNMWLTLETFTYIATIQLL